MTLNDWRKEEKLSFENLGRELSVTTSKAYRMCTSKEPCIRAHEAHRIIQLSKGKLQLEDLIGDC